MKKKSKKRRSYKKGARFEREVKRKLESIGLIVFRLARSKPFDLIGFDLERGKIYLIECKIRGNPSGIQLYQQSKIVSKLRPKFNIEYIIITKRNLENFIGIFRKHFIDH
ncbi:MAG: hypothetical protein DRP01_00545 [Archaeoglobales archaeon]|nr:MAG: hypothetical protein DRP01_00545 [Archaeoglobales archaeon]